MIIGITPRHEQSQFNIPWLAYEITLLTALRDSRNGVEFCLVSPFKQEDLKSLDLIVLSGGETPGENSERDDFETSIYKQCIDLAIPVLGICRGAQLIAMMEGSDLVTVAGHLNREPQLNEYPSLGKCFHGWGIIDLPSDWKVHVRDKRDHTIELFQHSKYPVLGIMSHPERLEGGSLVFSRLLELLKL